MSSAAASPAVPPPVKLTATHWLILTLAAIGFAFDIYEILMAQFIVKPAMRELGGFNPTTEEGKAAITYWRSMIVYVPAIAGGVFGLLGGYLTDYLGRRRVLTWSIIIYGASAFLAAYSTSLEMLLILRSTTFIGVCVEFVAAVAWLAELFDNPHQRERVLGYTQAFSSFGGLLVAIAFGIAVAHRTEFPPIVMPEFLEGWLGTIKEPQAAWRYTLMSGLFPALPLILIRPFLPESPKWKQKKEAGTLKRPSIRALFAPQYRRVTIVTTLMFACAYGAAFGAIQHIPAIVAGLDTVKEKVAEEPTKKNDIEDKAASEFGKVQELGGLVGRFLLALLAIRIVSRRALLRVFQLPGLIVFPLVFYFFLEMDNIVFYELDLSAAYMGKFPISTVSLGVFLAGLFAVAQFSFWGNYLPRVFPVHLRGTGESFAANIGGRALGVGFWGVTNILAIQIFSPSNTPESFAKAAAVTGLFVFAVGSFLCFFLPEPKTEELPD